LAESGHAAAHCIDPGLTMHYALAEYGIASQIQAVGVGIVTGDGEPRMIGGGAGMRPCYNRDGTFNGHSVLVIPVTGRLLDPTVQQFDSLPRTLEASRPLLARLPVPGSLGTRPFPVDRTDHFVLFVPLPPPNCDAWQHSQLARRAAEYREAGANLAAHVADLMRRQKYGPGPTRRRTRSCGRSSSAWRQDDGR
jgi:hypothetical protein